MSKSFRVFNGDIQIGPKRALDLVEGGDKLRQDLELWVLERVGIDPSTPSFGSKLDGGRVNGVEIPSVIGQIISDQLLGEIRSEVISLIQRYQSMQYDKLRSETIQYRGKNTLSEDEIVSSIDKVNVTTAGTTVVVQAIINTLNGNQVRLTIPIDTSGTT
jgi:hypothetical protein